MVFTAFLLGAQHKNGIVWRTSRQACLLCPCGRHLTGRLHLYEADRWRIRTLPGYNCEVAHPACRKGRFLGTHQWQSALLVVGLPVTHDWLEIDCHLSPSLISIRFTAWNWIAVRAVPPSRGKGGVITTTTITRLKTRLALACTRLREKFVVLLWIIHFIGQFLLRCIKWQIAHGITE